MNIYPSILTDLPELVTEQLETARSCVDVEVVQIMIVDALLADNITVTPTDLVGLDFSGLQIDIVLLTDEPMDFVYELIDIKGHLPIRAVIGQVEHMSNQEEFILEVKKHGWRAGLSLDLYTPYEAIDEEVCELVDIIQQHATTSLGQRVGTFQHHVVEKVQNIRDHTDLLDQTVEIVVEGGITPDHIEDLETVGVDSIAVGRALWESPDFSEAIEELSG